jgi:flavodoxin/ferredoxin
MRAAIFYFSQTGNTRRVAEAMQEVLAVRAGSCALYRLEQADPAELLRYDLVGLGCPAFYFREPMNVKQFIQGLPVLSRQKQPAVFIFATHGGTPGAVLFRLKHLCLSKNLRTIGAFQCLGVDTFPPFADRRPQIAAGHPDDNDLARARQFAMDMLTAANDRGGQGQRDDIAVPLPARILARLFSDRGLRRLARVGLLPRKIIIAQRCNRCGLCVQACPQGIIALRDLPVISELGCIYCYHCHRTCPREAMACNWRLFRIISGHYLRKYLANIFRRKNEKRS